MDIVCKSLYKPETHICKAATAFASKLLMPEDMVRDLVDKQGIKSIGELAEKFEVPASAMRMRVLELGYKLKDKL